MTSTQFHFFAGKGGVGKTTCAAARAVSAADGGARVLAVSTDPAHSLGDALGVALSSRPRAIVDDSIPGRVKGARRPKTRGGSFLAVELDAAGAFARWIAEHRRALGDVLEHGTWLDRVDIDELVGLPIPGVDELVGLLEIVRLARAHAGTGRTAGQKRRRKTDAHAAADSSLLVIVDTAPTGHTLRLLAAPATVASAAEVLDSLQVEHRIVREQLARVAGPDAADRLIALLATQANETAALISDPRQSAFHWVMLPEALSLEESVDALATLRRMRVPVVDVIVNRVLAPGPACSICDRIRGDQQRVLARVRRRFEADRIRLVPAEPVEPRGTIALRRIGRELTRDTPPRPRSSARRAFPRGTVYSRGDVPRLASERIAALQGARLLLVGGKGGVGKTTVAAAIAIRLARADPVRRVLLMSADPAHSLADVLGASVGDEPAPLAGAPGNLLVREIDAPALLASHRADIEAAIDEIAAAAGAEGTTGVRGVAALAPPGIDELLAIVEVADLIAHDGPDLIVLDTAPTGHALRLLQMPGAAHEWLHVLLRMLLKYRSVVRPGRLASELVELSKSIRRLQTILTDSRQTRFLVVTRAAEVPRLETQRLLVRLRRLRIAAPLMIVNALTRGPGRCPRCRAVARAEARELSIMQRACRRSRGGCAIILTPLAAPPPRGRAQLEKWAGEWEQPSAE